jgi:hypothetical protein
MKIKVIPSEQIAMLKQQVSGEFETWCASVLAHVSETSSLMHTLYAFAR